MIDGREGEKADGSDPQKPHDPISTQRFAQFVAVEQMAGASRPDARSRALAAMGEHDAAAAALAMPTPPAMDAETLASCLRSLNAALRSAADASKSVAA